MIERLVEQSGGAGADVQRLAAVVDQDGGEAEPRQTVGDAAGAGARQQRAERRRLRRLLGSGVGNQGLVIAASRLEECAQTDTACRMNICRH